MGTNSNGSKWIRKKRRLAIYLRDLLRCVYCDKDLDPRHVKPNERTLDHVIPTIYGGWHESHNLITACRSCNSSRQDKDLELFCSEETIARIKKQTDKDMAPFLQWAQQLLDRGEW